MAEETKQPPSEVTTNPDPVRDHSAIFGVSLRGLIAMITVTTICAMSLFAIEVKEPLYTLGGMIVGFYFGQNQKKQ